MLVTLYKRPDGQQEIIDVENVHQEDWDWFEENNISLSMEDLGNGMFALYADYGAFLEDGETPDEIIYVASEQEDCKESFRILRALTEEAVNDE